MWPFKKDEENKESTTEADLGKTIRNLTDQIGALQQQLAESKKQIEQANEQAQDAQAKQQMAEKSNQAQGESVTATQDVLRDTQAQVSKLEKQLGELAQAKQQAEAAAAAAQAQAAQAQTAPAATQAAPAQSQPASGGGSVLAAPAADAGAIGGLAVGGTAWVQRAGGKNLRLRSAPGLNSEVLGAINPGTQLSLLEGPQHADGHAWWHITAQDGREGWVAGEELLTHPE